MERTQKQGLAAVAGDTASGRKRGEHTQKKKTIGIRCGGVPCPSSPFKEIFRNLQPTFDVAEVRDAVDPDGERLDEGEDALAGRGVEVERHRSMIGLDG